MPDLVGYARVSTNGQERSGYSLDEQKAQLKAAGCIRRSLSRKRAPRRVAVYCTSFTDSCPARVAIASQRS